MTGPEAFRQAAGRQTKIEDLLAEKYGEAFDWALQEAITEKVDSSDAGSVRVEVDQAAGDDSNISLAKGLIRRYGAAGWVVTTSPPGLGLMCAAIPDHWSITSGCCSRPTKPTAVLYFRPADPGAAGVAGPG